MIDRLGDLYRIAQYEPNSQNQNELEQCSKFKQKQEGLGDDFFEEIKSVKQMIAILKNNNYKMHNIKAKYSKAIKSEQQKSNSSEMNAILQQNNDIQHSIKQKLQEIKAKVVESQQKEPNQPETRMKKNFFMNLSEEVKQIIQQQQNYEQEFQNTVKQKVTRQVRSIDRTITEDQIDQYVANPSLAFQMLQRKTFGQSSQMLKNTVSDIQDKFKDIVNLEASVRRCVELFQELQVLVFAQGQMIDSIEKNVAQTNYYVKKAQKKLQSAVKHHKSSKKFICKVITGIILSIIAIVIIFLLL